MDDHIITTDKDGPGLLFAADGDPIRQGFWANLKTGVIATRKVKNGVSFEKESQHLPPLKWEPADKLFNARLLYKNFHWRDSGATVVHVEVDDLSAIGHDSVMPILLQGGFYDFVDDMRKAINQSRALSFWHHSFPACVVCTVEELIMERLETEIIGKVLTLKVDQLLEPYPGYRHV